MDLGKRCVANAPYLLKNYATTFDDISLGLDVLEEGAVIATTVGGAAVGTVFEGEPVTGVPSGAFAGWITGETNPGVQSIMTVGNGLAGLASGLSISSDVISRDTSLQVNLSSNNNGLTLNGDLKVSSNTEISAITGIGGFPTKIVEFSLGLQAMAVANDYGKLPVFSNSLPFSFNFP